MNLRKNILANYASQLYVTAVGILMVPLYIKYMGAEAYGLVGFFAMLQAFFNLLDMGLTPTVARETSRYNGGATTALNYRRFIRALEGVFFVVAIIGGVVLFFAAELIAEKWLSANTLPLSEIVLSLKIVALVIALRWVCGLYRGVVSGAERLVWLSAFNSGIATFRYICIIPILIFVSESPIVFFVFQLIVAIVELICLVLFSYRLMPKIENQSIRWDWAPLKPVIKFSLTIAFTTSVWILVTQVDKLVLSAILPLADYGYFTVAVLVASGIFTIGGPVSTAVMPRLARLQASGQEQELIELYRKATQWIVIIVTPATLILACMPEQVLWAWTGNQDLVESVAPVLTLYSVGYGILVISAYPYYLQYAKGDLKLHLIGNILFLLLLVPSTIWAATYYGAIGAGWAWLISNVLYLLLWTPLVHQRFAPGLHKSWLLKDIVRPAGPMALTMLLVTLTIGWSDNRMVLTAGLLCMGVLLLVVGLLFSGMIRYSDGKFYFSGLSGR